MQNMKSLSLIVQKLAFVKANMNSDMTTRKDSHIFLANLYLKQGIGSEYVTVDSFARAYLSCEECGSRITKWKIPVHSGIRTQYLPL